MRFIKKLKHKYRMWRSQSYRWAHQYELGSSLKVDLGDTKVGTLKVKPINEVKEEYKKPNRYIGSGINGVEVKKMLQGFLCRYKNGYIAHEIGSAVEYLLRAPFKNGLDDVRKAGYIITRLVEDIESGAVPWEYEGD